MPKLFSFLTNIFRVTKFVAFSAMNEHNQKQLDLEVTERDDYREKQQWSTSILTDLE